MLLLFVDDTKVFRKIQGVNDEIFLQQDLDSLVKWTKKCGMKFNAEKCEVMSTAHSSSYEYKFDGVKLQQVLQERDLGVDVTSSLKPSAQCSKAVASVMRVLGIIRRNFVISDKEDFRLLFSGFMRPHLEYCVQVWSPYMKKDIELIERVHRRATKLVKGLKFKSYKERLSAFRSSKEGYEEI